MWFWHDHFATGLQKVRVPYLMWQQHLLRAPARHRQLRGPAEGDRRDPAMLVYLDGITQHRPRPQRELRPRGDGAVHARPRQLHGTGRRRGRARPSPDGWSTSRAGRGPRRCRNPAWTSTFIPRTLRRRHQDAPRHHGAPSTWTARSTCCSARPPPPSQIASKLYASARRDPARRARPRRAWRGCSATRAYEVMPLVEAIVADPAFLADAAVGAKARSPIEKLVGLIQAVPLASAAVGPVGPAQRGTRCGPSATSRSSPERGRVPRGHCGSSGRTSSCTRSTCCRCTRARPTVPATVAALLARFALFDVSDRTRTVLAREDDPARRLALVLASPEFAVV